MEGAVYLVPSRVSSTSGKRNDYSEHVKMNIKGPNGEKTITNSALAEHSFKTNHRIERSNASIVTCNPCYFRRVLLKACYTNNVDNPLNKDDGILFPEVYRHVINQHKNNTTGIINANPIVGHIHRLMKTLSKRWVLPMTSMLVEMFRLRNLFCFTFWKRTTLG